MKGRGQRPLAPLSDEDLVRRYQQGTDPEAAFDELYERYRTLTYAFLRRRIGLEGVAAEENQELYLTVVGHLKDFRCESSFRTWLFQIAHYRLAHLRRRWRVHVDERAESLPEAAGDRIADSAAGNPERRTAALEVSRKVRRCVAALPEIERAVIYGQYSAGITLRELTEDLKLTNASGARALLLAAQRRLKQCLEASGVTSSTAGRPGEGRP